MRKTMEGEGNTRKRISKNTGGKRENAGKERDKEENGENNEPQNKQTKNEPKAEKRE
jgi:hypothetical protein